jgi:hypothetical protein
LHLIPTHVSHYGAPLSMQGLVLNLIIFSVQCSSLISLVVLLSRINICWINIFCCRVSWASEHQPCKLLSVTCQIWYAFQKVTLVMIYILHPNFLSMHYGINCCRNSLSVLRNLMASQQSIYMTSTSPVNSHSNMPMDFQDTRTDKWIIRGSSIIISYMYLFVLYTCIVLLEMKFADKMAWTFLYLT